MSWFLGVIRGLFAAIDKVVVWLIECLYDLIFQISSVQIFDNTSLAAFANRITVILSIFMIFKLSLSFLNYIVNPDAMTDKSKGFSKLIQNIAVALVLLVSYQFLFDKAMELQQKIVDNNTVPKLILGSSGKNVKSSSTVSFSLFAAFIQPNEELLSSQPNCRMYFVNDGTKAQSKCNIGSYKENAATMPDIGNDPNSQLNYTVEEQNTYYLFDYLLSLKRGDIFAFDYKFIISTICGAFAALVLLSFCMDVAVRIIKLYFLRLIAPIPIISYVDPIKGEGIFKKWLSNVGKTYADLFVRLIAIFFAIFVIQQVSANMGNLKDFNGNPIDNPFVIIFIIIGALMFAKQFPKLIQDITGISLDGKMQLNPFKKIEEGAIGGNRIAGTARTVGGLVGNGLKATGRLAANSAGGGLKKLAGSRLKKSDSKELQKWGEKLSDSGSRTLKRGVTRAGKRSLAGLQNAGSNFVSSTIKGEKYQDKSRDLYKSGYEKSEIFKEDKDRKEAIKDRREQQKIWESGKKSLDAVTELNNASDYTAAGFKHDEYIKSAMKLKQADDATKAAQVDLNTAQSNMNKYGSDTIDSVTGKTYGELYRESYKKYETADKVKKGMEANHERNKKIYADDAKLETGRKIAKGPSPDGNSEGYNSSGSGASQSQNNQSGSGASQSQNNQSGSGASQSQNNQSGSGTSQSQNNQSGSGASQSQNNQSGSGTSQSQNNQSGSGASQSQNNQSGSGASQSQNNQLDFGTSQSQNNQSGSETRQFELNEETVEHKIARLIEKQRENLKKILLYKKQARETNDPKEKEAYLKAAALLSAENNTIAAELFELK